MEQKLIELTSLSKKALSFGETLCSKADALIKDCKTDIDNVEIIYPKLRFLWYELQVQAKSLDRLKEFAINQTNSLKLYNSNKEKQLAAIYEELDKVLNSLRNKIVNPAIRKSALTLDDELVDNPDATTKGIDGERTEREENDKVSLYDYIDEISMQELKHKTQEEVANIQQFQSVSSNIVSQISAHISHFRTLFNNCPIDLEESSIAFIQEKSSIHEQETKVMAESLLSLARHDEQVSAALKSCQSNAEMSLHLDISVLEKDTRELPTVIEELKESLQIIKSTSEEISVRSQVYNASYNETVKLFDELDAFGNKMEEIVAAIKANEADFEKGRIIVDRFIDELWNLIGWYEEFSKSYDYLIIEIDRRHRVVEQHSKLADEFYAKLESLYLEETQQRNLFFQMHGQYIPMDLCPPIQEQPIRYEIIPQTTTRLPIIPPKALTEAS
ncbi:10277_t:CDS:10 [Paraglomus occultum]|uniref:Autophagy-related protein 17 n=1 Tax=Paraglomus occultum TaxID=144539 RepID=A0A9N9FR69_9GLOM|nr:10277_t:CDS:10 [Paraglomus occultum]